MTHGSLFSGIGGFDLPSEWMGWENLFHCEWNPFGQRVLKYYWPDAELFTDITKSDFTRYANRIDVLSGGFPCQPYSQAGKRLGKEDERHLWPQMLRAIREIQPGWVVGENVRGLTNWNGGLVFDEVQADLESEGYEVLPFLLPACAKNAPHRRDRIWFIAYNNERNREKIGLQTRRQIYVDGIERVGNDTYALNTGLPRIEQHGTFNEGIKQQKPLRSVAEFPKSQWARWPTQSPVCSGNDGIPRKLDGITFPKWRNESIKAYGNAIVPQVAFEIFKAIQSYATQIRV